jgi:hypothetical protein
MPSPTRGANNIQNVAIKLGNSNVYGSRSCRLPWQAAHR